MNENDTAKSPWKRRFIILFIVTIVLPLLAVIWLVQRFGGDVPVDHASPTEHFKYGSTGGEHDGFPLLDLAGAARRLPAISARQGLPVPGNGFREER